jgi:hypothetical protein
VQDIKKLYYRWLELEEIRCAYSWFLRNKPLSAYRQYSYTLYLIMEEKRELREKAREWGLSAVNPYRGGNNND